MQLSHTGVPGVLLQAEGRLHGDPGAVRGRGTGGQELPVADGRGRGPGVRAGQRVLPLHARLLPLDRAPAAQVPGVREHRVLHQADDAGRLFLFGRKRRFGRFVASIKWLK